MNKMDNKPRCRYEPFFFLLYVFLEMGLAVFNQIGLLYYVPHYSIPLSMTINAGIVICGVSTFLKIAAAYYSDRQLTSGHSSRRAPYILASLVGISTAMLLLSLCPLSKGSRLVIPWFVISLGLLFVSQNILFKMIHLFLWEITHNQTEYTNYVLVLEPIGSALGSSIGLMLALKGHEFVFIAMISSSGTIITMTIILNSYALHMLSLESKTRSVVPLMQIPIIPSIRLVARTKEFQQVFLNILYLDFSYAFLVSAQTYMLLFGFSYLHTYADFRQLLISIHVSLYVMAMLSIIACRVVISFTDKLGVHMVLSQSTIVLSLFMFAFSFSDITFIAFTISMILAGCVLSTQLSFKSLFIRDLAVLDTFYSGFRREGIYQLAIQLPEGILSTICGAIPQLLLPLTGWYQHFDRALDDDVIDNNYVWTGETVWMLRLLCSLGVSALSFCSFISIRSHQLHQSTVDEMSKANKQTLSDLNQTPRLDEAYLSILHLSDAEVRAIAANSSSSTKELNVIYVHNRMTLALSSLAIIVLVSSAIIQLVKFREQMLTVTLITILLLAMYALYEYLRIDAIRSLFILSKGEIYALARRTVTEALHVSHYGSYQRGYTYLCSEQEDMCALTDMMCERSHEAYTLTYHFTVLILLSLFSSGLINIILLISI